MQKCTGRVELLNWINVLCVSNYTSVAHLNDALLECQVIEMLTGGNNNTNTNNNNNSPFLEKLSSYDCNADDYGDDIDHGRSGSRPIMNVRRLQEHRETNCKFLEQLMRSVVPQKWKLQVNYERLAQGKLQDHVHLLTHLNKWFVSHVQNGGALRFHMDPVARRLEASTGKPISVSLQIPRSAAIREAHLRYLESLPPSATMFFEDQGQEEEDYYFEQQQQQQQNRNRHPNSSRNNHHQHHHHHHHRQEEEEEYHEDDEYNQQQQQLDEQLFVERGYQNHLLEKNQQQFQQQQQNYYTSSIEEDIAQFGAHNVEVAQQELQQQQLEEMSLQDRTVQIHRELNNVVQQLEVRRLQLERDTKKLHLLIEKRNQLQAKLQRAHKVVVNAVKKMENEENQQEDHSNNIYGFCSDILRLFRDTKTGRGIYSPSQVLATSIQKVPLAF